jgi:hypothetical protein
MPALANFPPETSGFGVFSHEALPRAEVISGFQPEEFVLIFLQVPNIMPWIDLFSCSVRLADS